MASSEKILLFHSQPEFFFKKDLQTFKRCKFVSAEIYTLKVYRLKPKLRQQTIDSLSRCLHHVHLPLHIYQEAFSL